MSFRILTLLGSSSDLEITGDGQALLKRLQIAFSLRIASAHRSPQQVETLVKEFASKGGEILICVAGKSAHLAGVVAALTTRPVIAVPVYSEPTAGFDSLLSMSQMPAGIPVATMGFGKSGFQNACLLAAQILALKDQRLASLLTEERQQLAKKVLADDQKHRVEYSGGQS